MSIDVDFNSENRVHMLKKRSKRCVCRYCGGELKLKRIVFSDYEEARVEIFCNKCNRIEYGVESEIYKSAKYYVENTNFNCFPELDDNERTKEMTVAKVCEIMDWEAKTLGFVNKNGFTVPLNTNRSIIGESIIITDEELNDVIIEDKWALD